MEGLRTFYGSPVSEHADRHLDLIGMGRLLALSPSAQLNALACLRYASEFGRGRVYALDTSREQSARSARNVAQQPGYRLFGDQVTYGQLASMVAKGAEMRRTRLTESFGFEDYLADNAAELVPLFAVSPEGRLRMFLPDRKPEPEAGWSILALGPAREVAKQPGRKQKVAKEQRIAD